MNGTIGRAFAGLRSSPGFSAAVLTTFTLGLGVGTVVFSAAWSLLLAPPPIADPARVVNLWQTEAGLDRREVAPANFLDWRRQARTLSGAAAYFQRSQVLTGAAEPVRIDVAHVSSSFFDVLGVGAERGRVFHRGEDRPLAVVSRKLVRDELGGGDPAGRVLDLDGGTYEIIGVAPATFDLPAGSLAWVVAPRDVPGVGIDLGLDITTLRDARYLGVFARLAPGVSVAAAREELAAIARRLESEYPEANRGNGIAVVPLADDLARATRGPLALLAGGAACVLLVACLNVAGLLFARNLGRRRELAVRKALGASRGRLARAAVSEGLLLALGGAAGAAALALWGGPALVAALPGAELAGRTVGVSPSVVLFAVAAAVVAAGLATLLPAVVVVRTPPMTALAGGRGEVGVGQGRLRAALVAAQAATAIVLVAGALLLTRTHSHMISADPGFSPRGVVSLRLWLPARSDLPAAERRRLLAAGAEAARAVPGVEAAGEILKLPLSGTGYAAGLRVEGREFGPNQQPDACWRAVTPGYFATMGIRLVAGRRLTAADRDGVPAVGLVNETLARRFWPAGDALGRRLATGLDGEEKTWVTIVGVVADTPQVDPATPAVPELYRPLAQPTRFGAETMALVVRTGPGFSIAALRRALRDVSPVLVVDPARSLDEIVREASGRQRLLGALLGLFGALALVLAGLGLYGVLAVLVSERRRELGVRLALGATATDVVRLVVRRAAVPILVGIGVGLPIAPALGSALSSLLWKVEPADPWSLGGAVTALALVAGLAAWLPARRAARLDPAEVLREE